MPVPGSGNPYATKPGTYPSHKNDWQKDFAGAATTGYQTDAYSPTPARDVSFAPGQSPQGISQGFHSTAQALGKQAAQSGGRQAPTVGTAGQTFLMGAGMGSRAQGAAMQGSALDARAGMQGVQGMQTGNLQLLNSAQLGNQPSVAQLQQQRGIEDAQRAQMSAALSGQFNPNAQRQAAMQGAQMAQHGVNDAAQLRAAEMAQARGQYLQGLQQAQTGAGQIADQVAQQQGINLQQQGMDQQTAAQLAQMDQYKSTLGQQQTQINDAREQAMLQAGLGYDQLSMHPLDQDFAAQQSNQQRDLQMEQMRSQNYNTAAELNNQIALGNLESRANNRQKGLFGKIVGGIGAGIATIASDEDSKEKIRTLEAKNEKLQAGLNAFSDAMSQSTPYNSSIISANGGGSALDARPSSGPSNDASWLGDSANRLMARQTLQRTENIPLSGMSEDSLSAQGIGRKMGTDRSQAALRASIEARMAGPQASARMPDLTPAEQAALNAKSEPVRIIKESQPQMPPEYQEQSPQYAPDEAATAAQLDAEQSRILGGLQGNPQDPRIAQLQQEEDRIVGGIMSDERSKAQIKSLSRELAAEHFDKAAAAYRRGEWGAARSSFARANELTPSENAATGYWKAEARLHNQGADVVQDNLRKGQFDAAAENAAALADAIPEEPMAWQNYQAALDARDRAQEQAGARAEAQQSRLSGGDRSMAEAFYGPKSLASGRSTYGADESRALDAAAKLTPKEYQYKDAVISQFPNNVGGARQGERIVGNTTRDYKNAGLGDVVLDTKPYESVDPGRLAQYAMAGLSGLVDRVNALEKRKGGR